MGKWISDTTNESNGTSATAANAAVATMQQCNAQCNQLRREQSYIPMGRSIAPENSSSVCPADHMLRGGVHSDSQWTSEGRAIEYLPSSLSMEVQQIAPSFPGPHYDPFLALLRC